MCLVTLKVYSIDRAMRLPLAKTECIELTENPRPHACSEIFPLPEVVVLIRDSVLKAMSTPTQADKSKSVMVNRNK